MRRICSGENFPIERVMFETKIVNLLGQILSTDVNEDILYYMKLEAFWILTNFCITNSYECY
jgi:hypothetical protein